MARYEAGSAAAAASFSMSFGEPKKISDKVDYSLLDKALKKPVLKRKYQLSLKIKQCSFHLLTLKKTRKNLRIL